ncbi:predicted protein [Pyrenophora tritici-repentis Pt-1C-BFP]|uniref:Apple domain-containing protein n=1 Tax=Pyrenophora tritici-repentis (strain Pt-1C-BFP) TaxID=426418 RepID=B2W811_PYRTR|nr:uncharacterized protein PTRG_05949 [Pyrenophora tritici-repentis Pt-1C-BFP]EDU48869.1 predicted protein [Pyrenophora tritici-repentis Pt-1C-BFP]
MFLLTLSTNIILTLLALLPRHTTAAPTCGLVSTINDTLLPVYMGNFFYRGPTTFALCALYCKNAAPRCQSFRYSYWSDADAQYCEFYEYGLDGNATADDAQPYWYYDIDCAFPPYAETTISTTTATAAVQTVQQISTQTQIETETVTSISVPPAVTQTQTRTISQIQTATVTRTSIPSAFAVTVTSTVVQYQTQSSNSALPQLQFHHAPFP